MELCTLSLKIIYFWSVPNHSVTVNINRTTPNVATETVDTMEEHEGEYLILKLCFYIFDYYLLSYVMYIDSTYEGF